MKMKMFLKQELEKVVKQIYEKFKGDEKMIYTKENKKDFENAKVCYACEEPFSGYIKDLIKCRDHDHFAGEYRGAAHNMCNLMRAPNFIPVFFHNLEGYDSHILIKNLGVSEGNINCIPKTEEKYISFSKNIIVHSYTNEKGKKNKYYKRNKIYRQF